MLATTRSRDYLSRLLRYTISARPPSGFVRDFVVEHSGDHRGHLDLKAGGLVPIASLGRWIAMVTGDDRGSTITRLRRGQRPGCSPPTRPKPWCGLSNTSTASCSDNEIAAIRDNATVRPPGSHPRSWTH